MERFKKILIALVLPCIFTWFFLTIFVDVFTVPTVFRTVGDVTIAGKVGIKVFSKMNQLEILFGFFTLIGSFCYFRVYGQLKWLTASAILFCWSLFYTFYMTPNIADTTYLIHNTSPSDPMYAVLQSSHAYYHTLYRYLDTSKLIFLLAFIILVIANLTSQKTDK